MLNSSDSKGNNKKHP